MAGLGWVVSLAGSEQPSRQNEFIASFQAAAFKTPADLHALWNWFYLCASRDDNAGAFDAGRRLSAAAPGNPLALWAFLHALGARDAAIGVRARVMVERPSDENVAPLEPHEVDHVVACYRELHARRPELAQGEIILNVANELRWAKRTDDEERFYRETVAGASQIGQIAGALDLAGLRGDLPALVQLSERYYRLQAGRLDRLLLFRVVHIWWNGGRDVPGDGRQRGPEGFRPGLEARRLEPRSGQAEAGKAVARRSRSCPAGGFHESGTSGALPNLYRVRLLDRPVRLSQRERISGFGCHHGAAHGVRVVQAQRSLERPRESFPQPGRRGKGARGCDLSTAVHCRDPVVE